MLVVVASSNPVKVAATRIAFEALFPDSDIELCSAVVDSGVSDQPESDAETRSGARHRAMRASEAVPDADFSVGLEGGVERGDAQLLAFAWMAVKGPDGQVSEARSATLPLPPAVREFMDQGMELGEANDRVFATANSKQGDGAYGLLTEGRYTRKSIYTQTLIIALTPYVNTLYPHSAVVD